jgi:hypothetical protein
LLQLFETADRDMRADVIAASTERFERRLVEEIAGLRVQIAQVDASIRRDMAEMGASLRQEMVSGRVELLKWCFLFWVGQVAAIAGLMSMMLRMLRP